MENNDQLKISQTNESNKKLNKKIIIENPVQITKKKSIVPFIIVLILLILIAYGIYYFRINL